MVHSTTILTRRQKQLLDYLGDYIGKHGYAPTLEEIGGHFGLSSLATVHKHLTNLEQKRLIRRKENLSRAIQMIAQRKKASAIELPLAGRVAAGRPIEAIESHETIAVPEALVRKESSFVLQVKGDSMVGEGILDGDYVVVEERPSADNGDTVVAMIDGEATVKRFYREKGRVRLQPANERMDPIYVKDRDLSIRGVVVAVMRKYR